MFDKKISDEEEENLLRDMIHFTVMGTGSRLESLLDQPKRFEVGKLVRVDGNYTLAIYDKLFLKKILLRIPGVMAENDRFYGLALEAAERGKEPLVKGNSLDYGRFSYEKTQDEKANLKAFTPRRMTKGEEDRVIEIKRREIRKRERLPFCLSTALAGLGLVAVMMVVPSGGYIHENSESFMVRHRHLEAPVYRLVRKHQEVVSSLSYMEDEHGDSLPFRLGL